MKKTWAVALNMVRQGMRMRVLLLVLLFAAVSVFIFPFTLSGEGTLKGQLQLFVTYDLTMLSLLLSILTIGLSTASLCGEVKQKQIFILDSKPLKRWQIVAGKWLGVVILDLILLAAMGLASFLVIQYLARRAEATAEEREVVRTELLASRRSFRPPVPDIEQEVHEEYERLERMGRLPEVETVEDARREIYRRLLIRQQSVEAGTQKTWTFEALPVDAQSETGFRVRFKLYSTDTMKGREVKGRWVITGQGTAEPYVKETMAVPETFYEFEVPAELAGSGGEVQISYQNIHPDRTTVIFPAEDGMEVLVRVGGFGLNYLKGLCLIAFKLIFLAAVGVFCATFLTFPVASILTLCVFVAAMASGFAAELAQQERIFGGHHHGEAPPPSLGDKATRVMLKSVSTVLPKYSRYNPVDELNSGRRITPETLLEAGSVLVLLYGGILFALGSFIFERRQLAALHG